MAEITEKKEIKEDYLVEEQEIDSLDKNQITESIPKSTFKTYAGIFTSGSAFLSDGYQQGVMTMANVVLAKSFSGYNSSYKTMVSNSILIANIIGQIFFGFVCDLVGRKQAFVYTTVLIIAGAIICACANGSTEDRLFWCLIIGRGVLGVGVGGEYSTSASSSMESANQSLSIKARVNPFILSTNLPVSLGTPFATICFLIIEAIWKKNLNGMWRTMFGLGAVIPLSIFYFRWQLEHSNSYKQNAIKRKVPYLLIIKKYWKEFIATSGMWFCMDFILYPNNIFSASILAVAIPNATLRRTGEWQLFLSSFGVFGTFLSLLGLKFMTRRQISIFGFISYGIISFVVGGAFEKFTKIPALLIIFYAILNLLVNFGPASLQSVVSTESFPTPIRGTCYGFGAAIGKAGAAIGTSCFTPLSTVGKRYTFFLSGGVSLIGALIVWWGVPDYGDRNLDFLDEEFNQYLKDNNWDGNIGEEENKHHLVN